MSPSPDINQPDVKHAEVPPPGMSPAEMEKVHKVELLISTILRTGVLVSLILVVGGTIVSFVHHPAYLHGASPLAQLTAIQADRPHTLVGVYRGLMGFQGQAIIMLGLLLLIATPIVRVAVSILAFVYQRDRLFVLITSVVLILLLVSFVLGKTLGKVAG